MLSTDINIKEIKIAACFNKYLVINKCVTTLIFSNSSRNYLCNRSLSDIGALGYIGVF